MNIKLFKKGDIAVIAAVIIAALLLMFFSYSSADKPVAVISVDGVTVETVQLYSVKDRIEITPDTDYNIRIIAENGEIGFKHSDCEDKLCVASGKLGRGGEIAVCLPAKTVIKIIGADVDAVTY